VAEDRALVANSRTMTLEGRTSGARGDVRVTVDVEGK
jgi:hypothetical protein